MTLPVPLALALLGVVGVLAFLCGFYEGRQFERVSTFESSPFLRRLWRRLRGGAL